MSEYFLLYLFTRLDLVGAAFCICGIFLGAGAAAAWMNSSIAADKATEKIAKRLTIAAAACVFACLVIPSQKDVAMIVGGKLALDISRSQPVQDLASKIYNIVNKKLDEAAK